MIGRNLAVGVLAAAVGSAAQAQDRPSSFTVATASQGGTYFQYGSGWANLVGQALGVTGSAEVTGGPVQNMALVHTGDAEFGQVTVGPAAEALAGNSPAAPGMPLDQVRAVFPMYETPFTFITLASKGWDSWDDLPAGVRVGVGPAGGTADAYWPAMMERLGVQAEKRNAGYGDLVGQLQDGLVDALGFAAGVPTPAVSELQATAGISFIRFTPEQLVDLVEEFPVAPFTIEANTYGGQAEPIETLAMWNFMVANAALSDDFVYDVVKWTMENNAAMLQVHPTASATLPEFARVNRTVQWHPGAQRYFEEVGAELDASVSN